MQTAPSAIAGFTAVSSGSKSKASKEQALEEASGFASQLRSAMPDETDADQDSLKLNGPSVDSEIDEQRVLRRRRLLSRSSHASPSAHATSDVGASQLNSSADLPAVAEQRPDTNQPRGRFHESDTGAVEKFADSLAQGNKPTDPPPFADKVESALGETERTDPARIQQTTIADRKVPAAPTPDRPLVQDEQHRLHREQQSEIEGLEYDRTQVGQADSQLSTAIKRTDPFAEPVSDAEFDPESVDKTGIHQSLSPTVQSDEKAADGYVVAVQATASGQPSDSASEAGSSDQQVVSEPNHNSRSKTRDKSVDLPAREAPRPANLRATGSDTQNALPASKTGVAKAGARGDATTHATTQPATDARRAPPRKSTAANAVQLTSRDLPEKTASGKNEISMLRPTPLNSASTADPDPDRLGLAIQRPASSASRPSAELAQSVSVLPDIEAPLDPENVSEAFQGQLTERLVMAIKNDMSRADIRITPNELGPISIELTVEGNTASVSFAAENSQTRNALQDSLSLLRDQLAREGLSLGEASVGEQPNNAFNQRDNDHPTNEWTAVAGETADPLSETTLPAGYRPPASGQGLVDLFA